MVAARTSRRDWVAAGCEALVAGGPAGVRIEAIAQALGVTKGSFYGYFAGRAELLSEILVDWEQRAVLDAVTRAEAERDDPVGRARLAADLTFAPDLLPLDLAIRDWARRDPAVATRLRAVDNERIGYLRDQFGHAYPDPVDLEARCLLAFCAAVAGDLIAAEHPGVSREELYDVATRLLFGRVGPASR